MKLLIANDNFLIAIVVSLLLIIIFIALFLAALNAVFLAPGTTINGSICHTWDAWQLGRMAWCYFPAQPTIAPSPLHQCQSCHP